MQPVVAVKLEFNVTVSWKGRPKQKQGCAANFGLDQIHQWAEILIAGVRFLGQGPLRMDAWAPGWQQRPSCGHSQPGAGGGAGGGPVVQAEFSQVTDLPTPTAQR